MTVGWSVSGDLRRYHMTWQERGGPAVAESERRGFGYTVMVKMVERALNAEVTLDYPRDGLAWRMSSPSAAVLDSRTA